MAILILRDHGAVIHAVHSFMLWNLVYLCSIEGIGSVLVGTLLSVTFLGNGDYVGEILN